MQNSPNKRLVKNTLMLYIRTFFILIVSLFSVRIVLNSLGVEDYGIHNVIVGFITMFTFVSNSLSGVFSRFFSIDLERNDQGRLKRRVQNSFSILVLLAILLVVLIGFLGYWFINNKMNIPDIRINAANIVLFFSILTLVFHTLIILFDAIIVSREKMSAYAWISIIDSILKLIIAYLLVYVNADSLILYSFLLACESLLLLFIYYIYCNKNFKETSLKFRFEKDIIEILKIAVWDVIGSASYILKNYAVNIIINVFYGVIVNAARGIALQINTAITKFSGGFLTALRPQIIKNYAINDRYRLVKLINIGTKFSSFLLILLSIPIIVESEFILRAWLGTVPDRTSNFVILIIILSISEGTLVYAHNTALMATGKIKMPQIFTGFIQLMNIPISFLLLKHGFSPESTIVTAIIIAHICIFIRLYFLKIEIPYYSIRDFIFNVYIKVIVVALFASILPFFIKTLYSESFMRFILVCLSSLIWTSLTVYFIGCDKMDRNMINEKIKHITLKIK